MVVSWASPDQATRPHIRIGHRISTAQERQYTDALNGETVWTYHARVGGLRPGATYVYAVTADHDGNAADPFSATFRTAPAGRAAFRFTSFGDLSTPNPDWVLSYGQSAYAVSAVRRASRGCGATSATTTRPRPPAGHGCRARATTRWRSATARRAWPPT